MNLNKFPIPFFILLLVLFVFSASKLFKNDNIQTQRPCLPSNYNSEDQIKLIDYSSKTNKIVAILGCYVFIYDNEKTFSTPILYESGRLFNFVAFSPDGFHIALFDKNNGDLLIGKVSSQINFVYKINFSNPDNLKEIEWSPDGEKIAYVVSDKVYVYNLSLNKNNFLMKINMSPNIIQPRIKWSSDKQILVLSEGSRQLDNIYTTATLFIINIDDKLSKEIAKISINNTYFQRKIFDVSDNKIVFYSSRDNSSMGNKSIQEIHIKDLDKNIDRIINPPSELHEITGLKWLGKNLIVDWALHVEGGGTSLFNLNNYSAQEIHVRKMGFEDNRVPVWTQSLFIDEDNILFPVYEKGELKIYKGQIGLNNYVLLTSFVVPP